MASNEQYTKIAYMCWHLPNEIDYTAYMTCMLYNIVEKCMIGFFSFHSFLLYKCSNTIILLAQNCLPCSPHIICDAVSSECFIYIDRGWYF